MNIQKLLLAVFAFSILAGCRGKDGTDGSPGGSGAVYTGSITSDLFNVQIDNLDNNDSINVYYAEPLISGVFYQVNGPDLTDLSKPYWNYTESGNGYLISIHHLNGKNYKIVVWRAAGASSFGLSTRLLD